MSFQYASIVAYCIAKWQICFLKISWDLEITPDVIKLLMKSSYCFYLSAHDFCLCFAAFKIFVCQVDGNQCSRNVLDTRFIIIALTLYYYFRYFSFLQKWMEGGNKTKENFCFYVWTFWPKSTVSLAKEELDYFSQEIKHGCSTER